MNPIFLDLGFFQIRYYGLFIAITAILGFFLIKKFSTKFNIKPQLAEEFYLYSILWAVVGARTFEILFYNLNYYLANPLKILAIWEGGLASHGIFIAVILYTLYFTNKHKIKFKNLADLTVIPFALLGIATRLGNYFNNELVGINNHPVQLYQAGANFLIFLIIYKKRFKIQGYLFTTFLLLYSLQRFITEFFKAQYTNYYLGLNLAQYLSIITIIISIYLFYYFQKHKQK